MNQNIRLLEMLLDEVHGGFQQMKERGILIVFQVDPVMGANPHVFYLFLNAELLPGPVIEDSQDAINLPALHFFVIVEERDAA